MERVPCKRKECPDDEVTESGTEVPVPTEALTRPSDVPTVATPLSSLKDLLSVILGPSDGKSFLTIMPLFRRSEDSKREF